MCDRKGERRRERRRERKRERARERERERAREKVCVCVSPFHVQVRACVLEREIVCLRLGVSFFAACVCA